MDLTVRERLLLLQILPRQGDLTTIKIVRRLREELSFDEDEHRQLNFQQTDGQLTWNRVSIVKDVVIGEFQSPIHRV